MNIKKFLSERNKEIIAYEDYLYNFAAKTSKYISWRCRVRTCSGRIHTNFEQNVILKQELHTHESQEAEVNKLILKNRLKIECSSTKKIEFEQIYNDINAELKKDIRSDFNIKNTRDHFIKLQKKVLLPNAESNDDILEMYKRTIDNEKFLQYDNKDKDNRIIIFTTLQNIQILNKSNCWLSDGTFHTAPKNFSQLYIIHCMHFNNVIPTIYVLMANKTKKAYTILVEWLRENIENEPKTWIVDFEETAIGVFKKTYTNTIFNGCNYHFNQIIIRYLMQNKFIDLYKNCSKYREFIKNLLALAYFPYDEIKTSFDKMVVISEKPYIKVYNFFSKNFINNSKNRNTKKLEYWCVYTRVLQGIPTTTNSCEAYHRHINSNIKMKNSDLGTVINMLKKEEYRIRGKLLNIYSGKFKTPNLKKNDELINIIKNFNEYDINEYVKQILNHLKIFIK